MELLSALVLMASLPAQAPPPVPRPGPGARRQVLIAPLRLALDDPAVAEAEACLRRTLPSWKIARPTFAGKSEVPRPALVLRCRVDLGDGEEEWQFTLQWSQAGHLRLREAKILP